MTKKRPLTEKEKEKIRRVIAQNTAPDDRDPQKIIKEDYKGDADAYLRTMARWHNIPIGGD